MANEYRVSQFAVEALTDGAPGARVSQFAVEALHVTASTARVSQVAVEVLRSVTFITSSGRNRQVMLGSF